MLISNNRASFPLWWKKNLVKHLKKSRNVMKMILVSKYFSKHDHDLNNYGKLIIIELLRNICPTTTETIKERLKQPQTWRFSFTPDIKYPPLRGNHKFFIWYTLRTATAETNQENSLLIPVLSIFPLVQAINIPCCSRQTDR